MNRYIRMACMALTLALLGAFCLSLAEEMPIVVDQPLTEADLAEIEAQKRDELSWAQQLLIDLGYLTGSADGIAGPRTEAAVKQFQERRELSATGELDAATVEALKAMEQTVSQAKALQGRLIELGYLHGQVDGIFGERSQAALRLFQALNGLEATGRLDEQTEAKLFSEAVSTLPAPLNRGDKGDEVTALQERLLQFGFLSGSADGSYGKKTAAAVSRFQQHLLDQGVDEALGVEVSGEATPITRLLLMDADYSSYLMDIVPDQEGDEVTRVERRLALLGYMDAEADGVFDGYAVSAARAFLSDAGLPESDKLNRAAIDALFSEDAPQAEHFVLHDIAYGDKGVAVREAAEELMLGGMTAKLPRSAYGDDLAEAVGRLHDYLAALNSPQAALFADANALTIDAQQALRDGVWRYIADIDAEASEAEILRAQRRLYTLYYLPKYDVDGLFGEASEGAVRAFQEANGLAVTGAVDLETQRALFSTAGIAKPYPYRVEVDIDSQRVYVFQRNEAGEYEQIQSFICSTGLGNTTPRGIYLNGYPANRWHHFEKYDCWAQYSFEIEGNIMFHSVIYSEKDTDTLRYGSVYALGSRASHGCVRLQVKDARWLFEHCKRGSLVIVIY